MPDMVKAGDGYRFHVTGLTHDERGYPSMNVDDAGPPGAAAAGQAEAAGQRPRARARRTDLEDAEVVVVSYGITSRVAQRAIELARAEGREGRQVPPDHRPGRSPSSASRELAGRVKAFVVPELNLGQMVLRSGARRGRPGQGDPGDPRGRHGARPGSDSEGHCGGGR